MAATAMVINVETTCEPHIYFIYDRIKLVGLTSLNIFAIMLGKMFFMLAPDADLAIRA